MPFQKYEPVMVSETTFSGGVGAYLVPQEQMPSTFACLERAQKVPSAPPENSL